jgi:hypothetical protein
MAICKCVYATASGCLIDQPLAYASGTVPTSRVLIWAKSGADNADLMDSSHAFRSDTWAGPLGKTKAGQRY